MSSHQFIVCTNCKGTGQVRSWFGLVRRVCKECDGTGKIENLARLRRLATRERYAPFVPYSYDDPNLAITDNEISGDFPSILLDLKQTVIPIEPAVPQFEGGGGESGGGGATGSWEAPAEASIPEPAVDLGSSQDYGGSSPDFSSSSDSSSDSGGGSND